MKPMTVLALTGLLAACGGVKSVDAENPSVVLTLDVDADDLLDQEVVVCTATLSGACVDHSKGRQPEEAVSVATDIELPGTGTFGNLCMGPFNLTVSCESNHEGRTWEVTDSPSTVEVPEYQAVEITLAAHPVANAMEVKCNLQGMIESATLAAASVADSAETLNARTEALTKDNADALRASVSALKVTLAEGTDTLSALNTCIGDSDGSATVAEGLAAADTLRDALKAGQEAVDSAEAALDELATLATVRITVLHNGIQPLAGATVQMKSDEGDLMLCISPTDGVCEFAVTPNTPYSVELSADGYQGYLRSRPVVAAPQETVLIHIELFPAADMAGQLVQQDDLMVPVGWSAPLVVAVYSDTNGWEYLNAADLTVTVSGTSVSYNASSGTLSAVSVGTTTVTVSWDGQTMAFDVIVR
jgi:hypothetical protein